MTARLAHGGTAAVIQGVDRMRTLSTCHRPQFEGNRSRAPVARLSVYGCTETDGDRPSSTHPKPSVFPEAVIATSARSTERGTDGI
jgi:hypothetical protein